MKQADWDFTLEEPARLSATEADQNMCKNNGGTTQGSFFTGNPAQWGITLPDPVGFCFTFNESRQHSEKSSQQHSQLMQHGRQTGSTQVSASTDSRFGFNMLYLCGLNHVTTASQSTNAATVLSRQAWSTAIVPAKAMGMTFLMMYLSGATSYSSTPITNYLNGSAVVTTPPSSGPTIFTFLIIGYALINSIRTLLAIKTAFKPLDNASLTACVDGHSTIQPPSKDATRHDATHVLGSQMNQSNSYIRTASSHDRHSKLSFVFQKMTYFIISLLAVLYVLYMCTSLGLLPLNSGDYATRLIPPKFTLEHSFPAVP